MKDWPTDPMRQHNRFIAAFCDDLFDMCMNGGTGTPNADRVCEISRQINAKELERLAWKNHRDGGRANNAPPHDHGDEA